jgi:hypothetical protein
MTYSAKLKLSYHGKWTDTSSYSSSYEDDMLPEEHIGMEIPAEDLSSIQLFKFFSNFLRAIGHSDLGIMKGACATAFNETLDLEQMRKIAKEYDLKLVEDYRDEICKLEAEVRDLKAKLSRALNPENPNYTDEEVEAMTEEILQEALKPTVNTLKNAEVVCRDCGQRWGKYSVGCSSTWVGTCNVCGKEKSVTEVRDYGYLQKGIQELSK